MTEQLIPMNTYATLRKHYRNYPGKLLPSFNHLLAIEHGSPSRLTEAEVIELKALVADPDAGNEADEVARTSWLKIATNGVDRTGDTLALDGMDATNFFKNPQLLWMHGLTGLPVHTIGRILKIVPNNNALYALAEYASTEVYPFADQIYQLDVAGYLPANSIGFHPIEWEKNDSGGFHFLKWELIECSKVELPMNPNAIDDEMLQRKARSFNLTHFTQDQALRWLQD